MAVGYYNTDTGTYTLTEHWNGTTWSVVKSRNSATTASSGDNYLYGVSCTSTSSCTAVGVGSHVLVEHWNGSSWSMMKTPSVLGGELESIACTRSTNCVAVGDHFLSKSLEKATLVEQWNGLRWKVVPTPAPNELVPAR